MDDRIASVIDKIRRFRDERDWMQFHDPKNMALSIVIEAAELLELFQWKDGPEVERVIEENLEAVQEEIADVAIYLIELADNLGIDIISAIEAKLEKNARKYPVHKARGNAKKYTQF